MKLNVSKTKTVVFSLAPSPSIIPALKLDGNLIEEVETFKYLGAWVDRKLRWNVNTKKRISAAKQALGTLSRCRHYLPSFVTRLVYKTIILPKFLYATPITYPKNKHDQIAFEYVNKYAASLISDCHTGSYEDCIRSAKLDPVWKIVVERRLSLFRAYVDEHRFLPKELLHSKKQTASRSGLRSGAVINANENKQQFEKPISSQRQQCEDTALNAMVNNWNKLPNTIVNLSPSSFKQRIKSGEIVKFLIEIKVINPLEVPVRKPTWNVKK